MNKQKEIQHMFYTKANGERSERRVIIVSKPSKNYLTIDVTDCDDVEIENILTTMDHCDTYRTNQYRTEGLDKRWRNFIPSGIEWEE